MTTTWTIENVQTLQDQRNLVLVSTFEPESSAVVSIDDAHKLWMVNPSVVFQTGYRIAGTPEAITYALTAAGIAADQIEACLASSLSKDNYRGDMAPTYDEEVAAFEARRRAVVAAAQATPGARMFDVMAAVNPTVAAGVTKAQARTLGLVAPAKGKGRGAGKTLADKINELGAGKILDVSSMKPDGTGAHAVNAPTGKTKKLVSQQLPLMSADLEHYLMAINMLPGGEAAYADDIAYVQEQTQAKSPAATVVRGKPAFVPKVTVPTLAMPGVKPIPTIPTPGVTVPKVTVPNVTVPKVTVPGVTVPKVTVPGVTVPNVTVPKVTVPGVTVPKVTVPTLTMPKVKVPAPLPSDFDSDEDEDESEDEDEDEDESDVEIMMPAAAAPAVETPAEVVEGKSVV